MKIGVVFTGGTIGSRTNGSVVKLGVAPYSLLEGAAYPGAEFVTAEPYTILSEELGAENLSLLAECVRDMLKVCGAVIVTHGTDSLVYTAAFLSYVFSEAAVPIYIVSSGYPLDDERANGRQNFAAAVKSAVGKKHGSGVYVVWTAEGETRFCPGTRVLRQRPYDDYVETIEGTKGYAPPYEGAPFASGGLSFGSVMYLKMLPGVYYPAFDSGLRAVIIESYHSGTLCSDERFAGFMQRADALGIPVFIAGTGGRDADYETVEKYKALGAVPLPMSSPDAMYIKLCLVTAFTRDRERIKELMLSPFAGDIAE